MSESEEGQRTHILSSICFSGLHKFEAKQIKSNVYVNNCSAADLFSKTSNPHYLTSSLQKSNLTHIL